MPETEMRVRLTVDTRWAQAWVRAWKALAHIWSTERGFRIAQWGAERLIRFRMDNGPWRWGIR